MQVGISEELVQRIRNRSQILIWYLTAAFGLSAFAISTNKVEPLLIVPFLGLSAALWFNSQHRILGQMYVFLSEVDGESWYASKQFHSWLTTDHLARLATRLFLFWSPSVGCFLYNEMSMLSSTEDNGKYAVPLYLVLRLTSYISLFAIPLVIICSEIDRFILYSKLRKYSDKDSNISVTGVIRDDTVMLYYQLAKYGLYIVFEVFFCIFFIDAKWLS